MSITELTIVIPEGTKGRIDKVLTSLVPAHYALSRSRIQELIHSGAVFQEGVAIDTLKQKTQGGERITFKIPPPKPSEICAENIPLEILYEDKDIIIVNKPSGMVVHPAPTARSGTLVNALMYHAGDNLSGIGGVERVGIVHRIDKDTSGLLVVAKNDRAHEGLGKQFRDHSIERVYVAFTYGQLSANDTRVLGLEGVRQTGPHELSIDMPLGRHKTNRLRQAVRQDGRRAVTHIRVQGFDKAHHISEINCQLETGRTHQIRVHLNAIGFPLLGDPLYGKGSRQLPKSADPELESQIEALSGQALHAKVLGFTHPVTGEELRFESPLPEELAKLQTVITETFSPNNSAAS